MKFEFDHRTGTMQPKKDEEIYFAQSQGGGMIVDDKKHNIKFIIERDGRITKLFGSFDKDNLNLYDMRDARIISDRVIRLLGRDHKYSDFHYFLKGYVMKESVVKNCSTFLGESVWGGMLNRSTGDTIRKEKGRIIGKLEDGTRLVLSNGAFMDGDLVDFDGKYYCELENVACIAVLNDGNGTDTYYRYDSDTEDVVNMVKCFSTEESIREENNFGLLRAICQSSEWYDNDIDGLDFNIYKRDTHVFSGDEEYIIFTDYDYVNEYAIENEEDLLGDFLKKDEIKRFYDIFGDNFINVDDIKNELEEGYGIYFDDMNEDDRINELLRHNIIEKTDEFFDVDEDGDIDISLPKFDTEDYRDDFIDAFMNSIDDVVEEFVNNYGYDSLDGFADKHKLAELIVNADGPGLIIASYDGVEREETVDGVTYYIYRLN